MALGAGDFGVQAGERIPRVRMVETGDVFPIRVIVAGLAILAELPFVKILVAGEARRREAQKAFVQVLLADQ